VSGFGWKLSGFVLLTHCKCWILVGFDTVRDYLVGAEDAVDLRLVYREDTGSWRGGGRGVKHSERAVSTKDTALSKTSSGGSEIILESGLFSEPAKTWSRYKNTSPITAGSSVRTSFLSHPHSSVPALRGH